MLATIISSLVIMFISSLAYIAYKHPNYFLKKLYLPLLITSSIVLIFIIIWNIALSVAKNTLIELIPIEKVESASNLIISLEINWMVLVISYFALNIYFILLLIITSGLNSKNK